MIIVPFRTRAHNAKCPKALFCSKPSVILQRNEVHCFLHTFEDRLHDSWKKLALLACFIYASGCFLIRLAKLVGAVDVNLVLDYFKMCMTY